MRIQSNCKPQNEGMWGKVKILLMSSVDKSNASSLEVKHNFSLNKCFQCFKRYAFFSLCPEYNAKQILFLRYIYIYNFARLFILSLTQGEFVIFYLCTYVYALTHHIPWILVKIQNVMYRYNYTIYNIALF